MLTGFSVVEWIGSNLRELIPAKTIKPHQSAIKYTLGRIGTWSDWRKQKGYKKVVFSKYKISIVKHPPVVLDHKAIKTGWVWFLPFFQQVEVVDTSEETMDLLAQSITTRDRKQVVFSVNVVWQVVDLIAYMTNVQSAELSIEGSARVYCAQKARQWTFDELIDNQETLEKELKSLLHKKIKEWGVKIHEVGITDFAETKHYRFFGDNHWSKTS